MNSATLRLVLLISCCHALVHVYEHSLASVEKDIVEDAALAIHGKAGDADDPDFSDLAKRKQKEVSGELGNCLRLPFGFCALLAGWLADRYGAKRLLLIYLVGCSLAAALIWQTPSLAVLYAGGIIASDAVALDAFMDAIEQAQAIDRPSVRAIAAE